MSKNRQKQKVMKEQKRKEKLKKRAKSLQEYRTTRPVETKDPNILFENDTHVLEGFNRNKWNREST